MQKIAEFNSEHNLFSGLNTEQKNQKTFGVEKYATLNDKAYIWLRKSYLSLRDKKERCDSCLRNTDEFYRY